MKTPKRICDICKGKSIITEFYSQTFIERFNDIDEHFSYIYLDLCKQHWIEYHKNDLKWYREKIGS